ncbi:MAG: hypothetical protein GEU76_15370 [Alphaproteobacteria bacterium]|nr:hypothetical protein [Alphaproteobacteria bacterium]
MSSDNAPAAKGPRKTSHLQALLHGRTLLGVVMLGIFSVMVAIAADYPWQAAMLPMIIGIPGILLSLLQIGLDMHNFHKAEGRIDPRTAFEIYMEEITQATKGQVRMDIPANTQMTTLVEDPSVVGRSRKQREWLLWAYFYGLVVAVLLFGFWIGVPAFLAAFLRFYALESWRLVAMLTLACWVVMYVLLIVLLEQILFEGFVTGYVLNLLGPD